jgi:hypothetical protein
MGTLTEQGVGAQILKEAQQSTTEIRTAKTGVIPNQAQSLDYRQQSTIMLYQPVWHD